MCWVLAMAKVMAGFGRGRGEWGSHEGCQASKWDVSRGRRSPCGGKAQAAMVVRDMVSGRGAGEEETPWQAELVALARSGGE